MSHRSWTRVICIVGAFVALGCAGPTPEVSAADRSSAQTIRAESLFGFGTKRSACDYAVKESRQKARRSCSVAALSVDREACECSRGGSNSKWGCSVEAVFTCQ